MGYSPMVKIPTLAFWQETVFEAASSTYKKEKRKKTPQGCLFSFL